MVSAYNSRLHQRTRRLKYRGSKKKSEVSDVFWCERGGVEPSTTMRSHASPPMVEKYQACLNVCDVGCCPIRRLSPFGWKAADSAP
jgi:hypothetical protein